MKRRGRTSPDELRALGESLWSFVKVRVWCQEHPLQDSLRCSVGRKESRIRFSGNSFEYCVHHMRNGAIIQLGLCALTVPMKEKRQTWTQVPARQQTGGQEYQQHGETQSEQRAAGGELQSSGVEEGRLEGS